MQLRTLYIQLGRMIEHGHGRALVAVDKESFRDNRESDGCTILPVSGFKVYSVPQADDDGGHWANKDGTERMRTMCVLFGSSGLSDTSKGDASA
jgi:hypothetical protein